MAPVAKKRKDGAKAEKSETRAHRKQPWRRDPRRARGSIREGQGFAFWRKQKVQRDYKKLLKKNKNGSSQNKFEYTDDYPEHLKHLYLAEEEMLKRQKRRNDVPFILEDKDSETIQSNLIQRKLKTSNQKAKEEYEKIKSEQEKQKEAIRKKKEEREKAQKLYKEKKMEAYKILSKRTRKGQPNLNVQMEYLLQKIQQKP